jgi:ABC-type lipoprotein export system ATPase subunit
MMKNAWLSSAPSEADKFITKTKELSTMQNFSKVKGKDIIMIVGPTGSGKSTILNLIAGNKYICALNESD